MGFTHIELPAGQRASVLRLVGLSADRPLRADQPLRPAARTSRASSTAATQAGIGVIIDWVPAHFPTDAHGLAPLRRHGALRARGPAARLPPGLEHADLQFRPPEVRNFLVANALFWLERFHIDGAARRCRRLDALPRLQPQGRRVGAQRPWRAREPRGDRLPARDEQPRLRRPSGRDHHRRGIDRLAAGVAPGRHRRPRLRLQMEHGLDARHARIHAARPDPPPIPPPRDDLRHPLRLHGEFRAAALATTRSCTARARCSARCRATAGRSSPTCAPISASCGRIRARSSCSWAASSAQEREWNHDHSLDWHLLDDAAAPRRAEPRARPQPPLSRSSGAARLRLRAGGLRVDRRATMPTTAPIAFCPHGRAQRRARGRRLQLHAGRAARTIARRAARRTLDRAAQYRRGDLWRLECRQCRSASRPSRRLARAAGIARR